MCEITPPSHCENNVLGLRPLHVIQTLLNGRGIVSGVLQRLHARKPERLQAAVERQRASFSVSEKAYTAAQIFSAVRISFRSSSKEPS